MPGSDLSPAAPLPPRLSGGLCGPLCGAQGCQGPCMRTPGCLLAPGVRRRLTPEPRSRGCSCPKALRALPCPLLPALPRAPPTSSASSTEPSPPRLPHGLAGHLGLSLLSPEHPPSASVPTATPARQCLPPRPRYCPRLPGWPCKGQCWPAPTLTATSCPLRGTAGRPHAQGVDPVPAAVSFRWAESLGLSGALGRICPGAGSQPAVRKGRCSQAGSRELGSTLSPLQRGWAAGLLGLGWAVRPWPWPHHPHTVGQAALLRHVQGRP